MKPIADETWELALRYEPFVSKQAKRLRGRGVSHDILLTSGLIGMCHAIEKVSPKQTGFMAYAIRTVRSYLVRTIIEESRTIRISHWAVCKACQLMRDRKTFGGDPDWFTTLKSKKTRKAIEQAVTVFDMERHTLALSTLLGNRDIDDSICGYRSSVEDYDLCDLVETAIGDLENRDSYVIRSMYGIGCERKSRRETAEVLGVLPQDESWMRQRALREMGRAIRLRLDPA